MPHEYQAALDELFEPFQQMLSATTVEQAHAYFFDTAPFEQTGPAEQTRHLTLLADELEKLSGHLFQLVQQERHD